MAAFIKQPRFLNEVKTLDYLEAVVEYPSQCVLWQQLIRFTRVELL